MTVVQLLDRQAANRDTLEDRVRAAVLALWDQLGNYRDADVERFLARAVPLVQAGQRSLGSITSAYIANVVAEMTGDAVVFVPAGQFVNLRPTPIADVYTRPFVTARAARSRGETVETALALGRDRLVRLIEDDMAMAHRQGAVHGISGQADYVIGYRRVVRPERSRSGTCGLCIAASNEIYSREQLKGLHTRCQCGVLPILRTSRGTVDPGRTLNGQDIDEIYRGLKTTDRAQLAAVRVTTHQHGDLGPVLRERGDHFTGPADIPTPADIAA